MKTMAQQIDFNTYLLKKAPILFLRLDGKGIICQMNAFALVSIGKQALGRPFKTILVDFYNSFDLNATLSDSDTVHPLTVETIKNCSQTYQFDFYPSENHTLVFGHLDVSEIESMSSELVSTNQELNNLTRELNIKNRDLKRANEKIEAISRTDPLTQLANRRYFNERIAELISLAHRKSQPLSLIMTDIDKFKVVNDTYGHDVGDRVLQGYAALMKEATRSEDMVARFGGEEFIILLELTDIHQARSFAERIRIDLSQADLMGNGHFITASYGVSQYIKDEGRDNFIKRADTALYEAKSSGRNRTVITL